MSKNDWLIEILDSPPSYWLSNGISDEGKAKLYADILSYISKHYVSKEECQKLLLRQDKEYIKPYLERCQKQNGIPYCKNCGLGEEVRKDEP
jgi:hypothetical protein